MIIPGMKNSISVRKNEYQQKHLLLCILKELYIALKQQNPDKKLDFSHFVNSDPNGALVQEHHLIHMLYVFALFVRMLFFYYMQLGLKKRTKICLI